LPGRTTKSRCCEKVALKVKGVVGKGDVEKNNVAELA